MNKITRLTEAVTVDHIKTAVGTKGPVQLQKALIGNLFAASILLIIGDSKTADELHGANRFSYSALGSSIPRVTFWATVFEHLKLITKERKDLQDLRDDWENTLNTTIKTLYNELAKGLNADPTVLIDKLRVFAFNFNLGSDRRTLRVRAGIMSWQNLDKIDRNKVLQSAWTLLIEGDPDSPYLGRLRSETIKDIIKIPFSFKGLVQKIVREDGEGAPADAGIPTNTPAVAGSGTTMGNISPVPYKLFKGKIVRRMKKKFEPARIKRQTDDAKIYRIK